MDVTAGWCTGFAKDHADDELPPPLKWANRPPALFQYHLFKHLQIARRPYQGRAMLDEDLGLGALSPAAEAAVGHADLVYLSSHGEADGGTYRFRLREGTWRPTDAPRAVGPSVVVFDTCDLVIPAIAPKDTSWRRPGQYTPAIILGFEGPATDGYLASMRGRIFAEHLVTGHTFEHAWFAAIRESQTPEYQDQAIALAFGPTPAAARHTLRTASLGNPPKRTVADACAWRRS